MKKTKQIRFLREIELGKWYTDKNLVFRFIEDSTEGYLRGKIQINKEFGWNYRTRMIAPVKVLGSNMSYGFDLRRAGDTYLLECFNIYEANVDEIVENAELEVRKAIYDLKKAKDRATILAEELGKEIKI